MPFLACGLQYTAVLLPLTLKLGYFVQESCLHRLLETSTIPLVACCLQYSALLLPFTFQIADFAQEEYWQQVFILAYKFSGEIPLGAQVCGGIGKNAVSFICANVVRETNRKNRWRKGPQNTGDWATCLQQTRMNTMKCSSRTNNYSSSQ